MDDIIKSAREIALEKIEKLGEPTEEERLTWKYRPEGEALAGKFLRDDSNLVVELGTYDETAKQYVVDGAAGILIRNINLPKTDLDKKNNRKSMDGLKLLKNDKVGLENVFSKIRYLFNHYVEQGEQQRDQARQSLKAEMEQKIQQAMQQQMLPYSGANIDVEKLPQFQQEWRKLQIQMDSTYITHLDEHKRELAEIK